MSKIMRRNPKVSPHVHPNLFFHSCLLFSSRYFLPYMLVLLLFFFSFFCCFTVLGAVVCFSYKMKMFLVFVITVHRRKPSSALMITPAFTKHATETCLSAVTHMLAHITTGFSMERCGHTLPGRCWVNMLFYRNSCFLCEWTDLDLNCITNIDSTE